jgi:hypothetical protein
MKVLTSKVVDGQLDVPPGTLQDGETVTLVVHDDESSFSLTKEQSELLQESLSQVERGEWIDGWKLLEELKA